VPVRGRPPLSNSGAMAAMASGKVAGCTGDMAVAGGAAGTRPPDMVVRVTVIAWHLIGSATLHPQNSTETCAPNQWQKSCADYTRSQHGQMLIHL